LKQAFIDGYLTVDIGAKIKGIQGQESRRELLQCSLEYGEISGCRILRDNTFLASSLWGVQ